jgi:hypothetical protein
MYKKISGLLLCGVFLASLFGGNVVLPISGFSAVDAFADEGAGVNSVRAIEISPSSVRMTLNPGETRSSSFSITNRGTEPHTFRLSASPYQVKDEAYTPIFEGAESAPRAQIARWITFEQDSYTLEAEESIRVNFTINVPENAMGGGQYAAIFVSAETGTNSTINSVGRVGLLVYSTVRGDVYEQGEVVNHRINSPVFDKNLSVNMSVKNSGNADFVARHTMVVNSFFGNKQVFSLMRGFAVLPDTTRTMEMDWSETPRLGLFKVTSVIDADYVEKANENLGTWERTVLVIPLFLLVILIAIIVILIMMIVLKIVQIVSRRRRTIRK